MFFFSFLFLCFCSFLYLYLVKLPAGVASMCATLPAVLEHLSTIKFQRSNLSHLVRSHTGRQLY